MRRTAARIGIVAALALSLGVAAASAPPVWADTPGPLVSSARTTDGVMNYAVNLAGAASAEEFERALALVPSVGGAALASYPEIGTFFAQSASASFAPDLAAALSKAGVGVHSIGPTRVAPVPDSERVELPAPQADAAKPAPAPLTDAAPAADPGVQADPAASEGQGGDPETSPAGGGTESVRDEDASEASAEEAVSNWGAQAMSASDAAAVPMAHAPVRVGVIDSGIDDTHPDRVGRVDQSRSASCSVNGIASQAYGSWRDPYFHGTHVAGVIAANHNGIGIDGIAPTATLVSIKAAGAEGLIYPEYVTCAFMWASSHDIDIVNNS